MPALYLRKMQSTTAEMTNAYTPYNRRNLSATRSNEDLQTRSSIVNGWQRSLMCLTNEVADRGRVRLGAFASMMMPARKMATVSTPRDRQG